MHPGSVPDPGNAPDPSQIRLWMSWDLSLLRLSDYGGLKRGGMVPSKTSPIICVPAQASFGRLMQHQFHLAPVFKRPIQVLLLEGLTKLGRMNPFH